MVCLGYETGIIQPLSCGNAVQIPRIRSTTLPGQSCPGIHWRIEMTRIYILVIFDFDGKYDSVEIFTSAMEASIKSSEWMSKGAETELFYKYVKI